MQDRGHVQRARHVALVQSGDQRWPKEEDVVVGAEARRPLRLAVLLREAHRNRQEVIVYGMQHRSIVIIDCEKSYCGRSHA